MASFEQIRILQIIKNSIFDKDIVTDYRPDFLKNTFSGKNYEIDIYCKNLKIGFEYQGAVHFERIKRFKNNPDNSRLNDVRKFDLLRLIKGKLVVVEIFEQDLIGNIKQNIAKRCLNTAESLILNKQKYRMLSFLYLGFKYSGENMFRASNGGLYIIDSNGKTLKYSEDLMSEKALLLNAIKNKSC